MTRQGVKKFVAGQISDIVPNGEGHSPPCRPKSFEKWESLRTPSTDSCKSCWSKILT